MSRGRVHAFCGFLGSPADWEFLREPLLAELNLELRAHLVDPFPGEDWGDWTRRFLSETDALATGDPEILLGYSLGGRAAFHLAAGLPSRFAGLLALSANPGLDRPEERAARVASDLAWAERLKNDPWQKLLEDWDRQPVFGQIQAPALLSEGRKDSPALRARSVRQLKQLSVGLQQDLRPELARLPLRQTWMCGALDTGYCQQVRDFTAQADASRFRAFEVPGGGHRWPWEIAQNEAIRLILAELRAFLEQKGA